MEDDCVVICYEYFRDGYKGKKCIRENGPNDYSIRAFQEMPVSTMTLTLFYEEEVEIDKISLLLCLECIRNVDKKKIYPDGSITSVRYGGVSKGRVAGYFPTIMMDVWDSGGRVNVKISGKNLHIVGPKSTESGVRIFNRVKRAFSSTQAFWKKCTENPKEFLAASVWLSRYSANLKKKVQFADGDYDYEIIWPKIPEVVKNRDFIEEIILRYSDIKYVHQIYERSQKILELNAPISKDINLKHIKKVMVNYSYRINLSDSEILNLEPLCKGLCEKGYNAVMHYTKKRAEMQVHVYDNTKYEDDDDIRKKEDKLFEQGFYIREKGSVKHTGPGGSRQEFWYKKLMTDIISMTG